MDLAGRFSKPSLRVNGLADLRKRLEADPPRVPQAPGQAAPIGGLKKRC